MWAWKRDTPSLKPKEQEDLISAGKMKRAESPFRLQDADSAKPILLNNCSCFWNDYRQRYVMIASEMFGATMLGEVWCSEAERPEGPWVHARKIITHANKAGDAHDFYNPTQHPFFVVLRLFRCRAGRRCLRKRRNGADKGCGRKYFCFA